MIHTIIFFGFIPSKTLFSTVDAKDLTSKTRHMKTQRFNVLEIEEDNFVASSDLEVIQRESNQI